MDGWSDEGCRESGSQKLEDQGQGQRWLEAITRVGQDPAWVVVPGWMDGWITLTECVFVALGIQNVMRMRNIFICGLPCSTVFFHIISKTSRFSKKKLFNINWVFLSPLQLLSQTFFNPRRTERHMIKKVYSFSCEVPFIINPF
jgi:hypothetical protein